MSAQIIDGKALAAATKAEAAADHLQRDLKRQEAKEKSTTKTA